MQAAYDRGREDERTKTAFLNRISEELMQPVNEISIATDRLGAAYQRLTKAEMIELQQQINLQTETITSLIDQTLIKSKDK